MTNTEEDRVSVVYQTTYTHNQPVLNMMGERVLFCEWYERELLFCEWSKWQFLLVLGAQSHGHYQQGGNFTSGP